MANVMDIAAKPVRTPAEAEAVAREWVIKNPVVAQEAHDGHEVQHTQACFCLREALPKRFSLHPGNE